LRKATLRLDGRKRAGSISSTSGSTAAPIATSKGVCGSARKNPAAVCTAGSANGAVMRSSQSAGRRVPASVTAITAAGSSTVAIAVLRPSEMLQPGRSITLSGRRAAYSCRMAGVSSVEPPSTITTVSGGRVWAAIESSTVRTDAPSLTTVMIRATGKLPGDWWRGMALLAPR